MSKKGMGVIDVSGQVFGDLTAIRRVNGDGRADCLKYRLDAGWPLEKALVP